MIIDESIKLGYDRLLILDDDLSFAIRNPLPDARPMFRKTTSDELLTLFTHIVELVSPEMPIMSFTPIMSRSQPALVSFCKPMMMAYAYYLPHFAAHPAHRFWMGKHIEARCDLNLSLRLLTEGFLTGFMASCFIPDNVNNPGGCSTYRFLEVEKASVAYLKQTFPRFVKTHKKRGWMGDDNVIRDAPVISWQKAFNRTAFCNRFGYARATEFTYPLVANYTKRYERFAARRREELS
jgi:hypothetical protein